MHYTPGIKGKTFFITPFNFLRKRLRLGSVHGSGHKNLSWTDLALLKSGNQQINP
jgi:hypothetical protein